jgi:DNA-directed RNA polymerase I subunit RPA2
VWYISVFTTTVVVAAGYNRHGTEIMYSGVSGKPFPCEIFMGIVHYQRLRHMVLDKWQVRSKGPMNNFTHQPIKGRKRGGGIRVGEMERDAIIGNGCLSLINDRLMDNSDGSKVSFLLYI